jgi:hypothetical protein
MYAAEDAPCDFYRRLTLKLAGWRLRRLREGRAKGPSAKHIPSLDPGVPLQPNQLFATLFVDPNGLNRYHAASSPVLLAKA